MNLLRLSLVFAAITFTYVNAHGRLMQPVSRGSAWRKFPNEFPFTDQDDADFCNNRQNSTCGICGPLFHNDPKASQNIYIPHRPWQQWKTYYSFEKGSRYYTGKNVATYKKAQTVETLIRVNL